MLVFLMLSKHSGPPCHYALQILCSGCTVADGHGMWLSLGSADPGLGRMELVWAKQQDSGPELETLSDSVGSQPQTW